MLNFASFVSVCLGKTKNYAKYTNKTRKNGAYYDKKAKASDLGDKKSMRCTMRHFFFVCYLINFVLQMFLSNRFCLFVAIMINFYVSIL